MPPPPGTLSPERVDADGSNRAGHREVLEGGGGALGPKGLCTKNGRPDFPNRKFPTMLTWCGGEGGVQGGVTPPPPAVHGRSNTSPDGHTRVAIDRDPRRLPRQRSCPGSAGGRGGVAWRDRGGGPPVRRWRPQPTPAPGTPHIIGTPAKLLGRRRLVFESGRGLRVAPDLALRRVLDGAQLVECMLLAQI